MGSKSTVKHETSVLLTKEENEHIFQLLGPGCVSIATTVVQMFSADNRPDGISWMKRNSGVLCFVRDANRRSYFYQLYCLVQNRMIWEHGIYTRTQYSSASTLFLHTIKTEDGIVAFEFANENEATLFREKLLNKFEARKEVDVDRRKAVMNPYRSINRSAIVGRITKADIGIPFNFGRVSYGGPGPKHFLEVEDVDECLSQSFNKARLTESQLKDEKVLKLDHESAVAVPPVHRSASFFTPPPLAPSSFDTSPDDGNSSGVSGDLQSALMKGVQSGGINLKPVETTSETKRRTNAEAAGGFARDLRQTLAV